MLVSLISLTLLHPAFVFRTKLTLSNGWKFLDLTIFAFRNKAGCESMKALRKNGRRSLLSCDGTPNKSLDASGGSASLNLLGAAEGALIRAAASTQPLG